MCRGSSFFFGHRAYLAVEIFCLSMHFQLSDLTDIGTLAGKRSLAALLMEKRRLAFWVIAKEEERGQVTVQIWYEQTQMNTDLQWASTDFIWVSTNLEEEGEKLNMACKFNAGEHIFGERERKVALSLHIMTVNLKKEEPSSLVLAARSKKKETLSS